VARAEFPERPLKMVVGFSASGGTDVAARIVAPGLSDALGQGVVVECRPGMRLRSSPVTLTPAATPT